MSKTKGTSKNKVYILTFFLLLLGIYDFWLRDFPMLTVMLAVLALLNISRAWINRTSHQKIGEAAINICNAIVTGVAAYTYMQLNAGYLKWVWGILSFFYLLLGGLILLGAGEEKKR